MFGFDKMFDFNRDGKLDIWRLPRLSAQHEVIGVKKNIIIVNMGFIDVVMFNPVIVSKHDMYETAQICQHEIDHLSGKII